MWKLITIHMNKYVILEGNEEDTRGWFNALEYSPSALFAFLYDDKQQLVETMTKSV